MKEAIAGAVVGAGIQVVLDNVLSILDRKIHLFYRYENDLENLKYYLGKIRVFLRDGVRREGVNDSFNQWVKDLESAAFEAEDIVDELDYRLLRKEVLSKEKRRRRKVKMLLSLRFHRMTFRPQMGRKIRNVNEKLNKIFEASSRFGFQSMSPIRLHVDSLVRETDSYYADPIILGRENDLARIVERLVDTPSEQQFSVLSIVGMAGLGKTTLARQVFRHESIKENFQTKIWVHVSQHFDALILFRKILESLCSKNEQIESREVVLKRIQENLGGKTYLLVLDDIWNEQIDKWDDFMNSLSGVSSPRRNGIVVTTRSEDVALIVRTIPIYRLRILSDEVCWSIIKEKALVEGNMLSEFELVGKKIAERCQGLPLLAKVLGCLLRDKPKEEWISIQQKGLSDLGVDGRSIMKILKLSYDYLPSASVKKCFAYCSVFRKGSYMEKDQVIEHWMAQGFLENDQRNDMETVGYQTFNILVHYSLLQVSDIDDDDSQYEMHDLLHDLACSLLDDTSTIRYVGWSSTVGESFSLLHENAKNLRTLTFAGEVSDEMLSNLTSLRALALTNEDTKTLPKSIRESIHLRNLDISGTSIEYLPNSIGELYHLQTIRVNNSLNELPKSLIDLISLRHLHCTRNLELPPHIGRLTCLQTLPYFQVDYEEGRRIEELGCLKSLKGELHIWNLEKVNIIEEAMRAGLSQKAGLCHLSLNWDISREGERRKDENVLEGLQPHPNLKGLCISGFKGRNLPYWTLKMEVRDELQGCWIGLNNLTNIQLVDCTECEEVPMLGHLPHLMSLTLSHLTHVRSIGSSFYGIDKCRTNYDKIVVFPALKQLALLDMTNLTEWVTPAVENQLHQVVAFPCLDFLSICCPLLRIAPDHFPIKIDSVRSLQTLFLNMFSACEIFDAISPGLQSLRHLILQPLERYDTLPDGLQNLTTLQILTLSDFGIEALPEWFGNFSSLHNLMLINCEKLRHLPSKEAMQRMTRLNCLLVESCPLLKLKQTDDDSEYPKVSHIDTVSVDDDWLSFPPDLVTE